MNTFKIQSEAWMRHLWWLTRRDVIMALTSWLIWAKVSANSLPHQYPHSIREIEKRDSWFTYTRQVSRGTNQLWAHPIASLSKLVSIYTIYERLAELTMDPAKWTAQLIEEDKNQSTKNGESNKDIPIWTYNIQDLIKLSLIKSTNEAIESLWRSLFGGSRQQFLVAMNQTAKKLGMTQSRFDSPSWLSENNISTLSDLETLVLAILNSPYPIGSITSIREFTIPRLAVSIKSSNGLFMDQLPPGVKVVLTKTGYIEESWLCVITVVKLPNNKIYSIILLGTRDHIERRSLVLNSIRNLMSQ